MTRETKEATSEIHIQSYSEICLNQPLKCEIAFLLSEATKSFSDSNTKQYTNSLVLQMLQNVEREVKISVGLVSFQRVVTHVLWLLNCEDPIKLFMSRITDYHQTNSSSRQKEESSGFIYIQNEALAKSYEDLTEVYKQRMDYPKALQANPASPFGKKNVFWRNT